MATLPAPITSADVTTYRAKWCGSPFVEVWGFIAEVPSRGAWALLWRDTEQAAIDACVDYYNSRPRMSAEEFEAWIAA